MTIDEILLPLLDYACANGVIEDTTANRDLFDTKLMGIVTPMPREVKMDFYSRLAKAPLDATNWYYDFSKKLNYVRAGRIEKDIRWKYPCEYGMLDITINCSKPEKDPRDIAKARQSVRQSIRNVSFARRIWDLPETRTARHVKICDPSRFRSTVKAGICSILPTAITTSTALCSTSNTFLW